ncbi:DUF6264 family protein [Microbacterium sp.]|uniref:DUF6264 family protein n=1 Tax=Microbacterium sp. TaxID=51671 RepID=UPI0039E550D7
MSTPDPRPRPQYGEYATPEEQRARIQQPAAPVSAPQPRVQSAPATTVGPRPSRTADRIVTLVLLAYGLFTVVTAIPQLIDFGAFAQTWMQVVEIDASFTNVAQGRLWGLIGAAVFGVGWLATALWSWRSLSRRRITWWIPLVGAIATFVIASVCLTVPLLGDPAIAEHFASHG